MIKIRPRTGRPVSVETEAVSPLAKRMGEEHRRVREGKGVTLEALAKRIDRSINVIRFHENGTRPMRVDDLCMSADALGVSISMLAITPKFMKEG